MLEPKIVINHNAILSNLKLIKERLDKNVKVMAVVKSNAYGHGMIEVSKTLEKHVDMLAVGFVEEAIKLREHIKGDIFVMGPIYDFDQAILHNFVITLENTNQFNALMSYYEIHLKDTINIIRVHIKVDTGMHRFGLNLDELVEVMNVMDNKKCDENIIIEGIYSHFGSTFLADAKKVEEQYEIFKKVKDFMKNHYDKPIIYHISNSENGVDTTKYNEGMVRLGNGLYGPMSLKNSLQTTRVAKVLLPIVSIHVLKENSKFGYGFKKSAKKGTRLGAVKTGFYEGTGMSKMPIGVNFFAMSKFYFKSYLKSIIYKESVTYGSLHLPIIGMINMQFFQVDLTKTEIMAGDFVEYDKAPLYYKESVLRSHVLEGENGTHY
jgi:alanine racemase